MLWNIGDEKQNNHRQQKHQQHGHNSKQYLQLPTVSTLPTNTHQKRNSFHGYAPSSSPASPDCPPTLLVSMMNGPNSYGSSLLQLSNGHNWSAAASQEKLISTSPSGISLSPSMLRSQTQQQQTTTTAPSATAPSSATLRSAAFARTAKTLQQNARQHGSTDSASAAAAAAGISGDRKKRMELWAQSPSTAFHQSIDMRGSVDPLSALSNSCGHIAADEAATTACASGGRSGSVNDGGLAATVRSGGDQLAAASGYHSERRSAFCSGGTSRDHYGRQQQHGHGGGTGTHHQMLMFCTASGCSGHPPCVGHRPPPLRSAQSSIDESTGETGGMSGQFRDTYLTEISREWMRMNGAIAPFRNILQQASSTSTPLPNHRPIIQSPAAPAAAAAASTASAILGTKAATGGAEDELGGGSSGQTTVEAIQGSCHNLATVTAAATTEQRIVDQFVRSKELIGSANDVANGCGDAVLIIEPRAMSQKRYNNRSRTPSGTVI